MVDNQLVAQYGEHLRAQGRAPRTIQGYVGDLRLFARWLEQSTGEPFSPEQVTPLDIHTYKSFSQAVKKLAPATINRRLQSLRAFFGWAEHSGLVPASPVAGVEDIATTRRRFAPKSLDESQVHRLLRNAQKSGRHAARNYAMLQIMLQAGLRVSEVTSLHLGDVELGERSGKVRVRLSKGGKHREVPLNKTVREALRAYIAERPGLEEPGLFLSQRGNSLTSRMVELVVQKCAEMAGLEDEGITPHSLRHTFAASYLEQNPGELVELQALLGHSSLDTTAIYAQSSFKDVARKLERSSLNVEG